VSRINPSWSSISNIKWRTKVLSQVIVKNVVIHFETEVVHYYLYNIQLQSQKSIKV